MRVQSRGVTGEGRERGGRSPNRDFNLHKPPVLPTSCRPLPDVSHTGARVQRRLPVAPSAPSTTINSSSSSSFANKCTPSVVPAVRALQDSLLRPCCTNSRLTATAPPLAARAEAPGTLPPGQGRSHASPGRRRQLPARAQAGEG